MFLSRVTLNRAVDVGGSKRVPTSKLEDEHVHATSRLSQDRFLGPNGHFVRVRRLRTPGCSLAQSGWLPPMTSIPPRRGDDGFDAPYEAAWPANPAQEPKRVRRCGADPALDRWLWRDARVARALCCWRRIGGTVAQCAGGADRCGGGQPVVKRGCPAGGVEEVGVAMPCMGVVLDDAGLVLKGGVADMLRAYVRPAGGK